MSTPQAALARAHVERGRAIVARQRQLMDKLRASNAPCSRDAEELLVIFETTLRILEEDLERFEKGQ